jgi:hypothetical protein
MKGAHPLRFQPIRDGATANSGGEQLGSVHALALQLGQSPDLSLPRPPDLLKRTNRASQRRFVRHSRFFMHRRTNLPIAARFVR